MKNLSSTFCMIALIVSGNLFSQHMVRETVYFDHNKYDLTLQAKEDLVKTVDKCKQRTITKIHVTGHTDSDGSIQFNKVLSEKRASEVARFLSEAGISDGKLQLWHAGELQPVNTNISANGKQKNRRVEVTVEFGDILFPERFKAPQKIFIINPGKDTILSLDGKGSRLHIPDHCFVDQQGTPVSSPVEIRYTEYANPTDIAFSGLPMTYRKSGVEYLFNSSGMFELYGYSEGKPVQVALNKSFVMDYALAKLNPDLGFYRLNDDKSNWQLLQNISQGATSKVVSEVKSKRIVEADSPYSVMKEKLSLDNQNILPVLNTNLIADPGHTYPELVMGLRLRNFGVFNCDQYYNPKMLNIQASYVDEAGKPISDATVLSLIDYNYNGAYSFDPRLFRINPNNKNVLLLFTKSGELYVLSKEEFGKMKFSDNGSYQFQMKNVSATIKSSNDLANYLGLR